MKEGKGTVKRAHRNMHASCNEDDNASISSSSVSTSSLMDREESVEDVSCLDAEPLPSASPAVQSAEAPSSSSLRKRQRDEVREKRRVAVLTHLSLDELCVFSSSTKNVVDYRVPNTFHCVRGSISQFSNVDKSILPPLTNDCCQTFSALTAILYASFGYVAMAEECWNPSSVNYLVYLAAWLHQLTFPLRPERSRPRIDDLNECLALPMTFPATMRGSDFIVLFYDQQDQIRALLRDLCTLPQNASSDVVCGYVVVSGEYTVSLFSLRHKLSTDGTKAQNAKECPSAAWNLYIADSHGTLPWAHGKASLTTITLGTDGRDGPDPKPSGLHGANRAEYYDVETGLGHFAQVLFSLLEDHRKLCHTASAAVPYMTWTPIRRHRECVASCSELIDIIDNLWLPTILSNEVVQREFSRFGRRHPMRCFWGQATSRSRHPSGEKQTPEKPAAATTGESVPSVVSSDEHQDGVFPAVPPPNNLLPRVLRAASHRSPV